MPFLPPNQQRQSTEGTFLFYLSCLLGLLKIFTSHNGNIQEEKLYITQKSGRARNRGGLQKPKSGRANDHSERIGASKNPGLL